jgi:hypothetical protein
MRLRASADAVAGRTRLLRNKHCCVLGAAVGGSSMMCRALQASTMCRALQVSAHMYMPAVAWCYHRSSGGLSQLCMDMVWFVQSQEDLVTLPGAPCSSGLQTLQPARRGRYSALGA